MTDFSAIAAPLAAALSKRGYESLTPVQTAVIDPELVKSDALVSAQTGSGKTVAFVLAIAPTLLGEADKFLFAATPLALILAPTLELAQQVQREREWLYAEAGGQIAPCVGGMDYRTERRAYRRRHPGPSARPYRPWLARYVGDLHGRSRRSRRDARSGLCRRSGIHPWCRAGKALYAPVLGHRAEGDQGASPSVSARCRAHPDCLGKQAARRYRLSCAVGRPGGIATMRSSSCCTSARRGPRCRICSRASTIAASRSWRCRAS